MADPKADLRLPKILHAYLEDLADLGIYGKGKSQVMRRFIERGIQDALGTGLITPKKAKDFGEAGDEEEAD